MSYKFSGLFILLIAMYIHGETIPVIRSPETISDFELSSMNKRKADMIKWIPLGNSQEYYTISPDQVVHLQKKRFKEGKFLKYLTIKWQKGSPIINVGVPISSTKNPEKNIEDEDIRTLMAEYVTGFHKKICTIKRTGYKMEVPDFCIIISRKLPRKIIYNTLKEVVSLGNICENLYKKSLVLKNQIVGTRTLRNVMQDYPQFRKGLMQAIRKRKSLSSKEIRKLKVEIERCEYRCNNLLKRQQKLLRFLESPFEPDYMTMIFWQSISDLSLKTVL